MQLDDLLLHQDDLRILSEIKARPPVIRDLMPPSISLSTIYTVYRSVNKKGPPRGQLPQEIRVFFSNPKKRLHASVVLGIWDRFKNTEDSKVRRHINAYKMYVGAAGEMGPIYDFNRIWFLIRQYEMRRIAVKECGSCGQRYAYNREDVTDVHNCHGCAIIATAAAEAA